MTPSLPWCTRRPERFLRRAALLVVLSLGLAGPAITAAQPHGAGSASADARIQALEPFTGHWKGAFVVYAADGIQIDSLVTEHRYRWEGDVQIGRHIDRYPATGRVDTSYARNYVDDGQLICEVVKEDGTKTVHIGRVQKGAIVWHRQTEEGIVESYRERVVETPAGREYRIDGFGAYPDGQGGLTHVLFTGRYREVR
jgi:hypothetical protein